MSSSTAAVLELATAMLSNLSATARSTATATTTLSHNGRAATTANSLCSAGAAAARTATWLLVLYQRPNCLYNAGRMPGERRPMLSDKRRSGATLPRSLLVLHQRTRRAREFC